MLSLISLPSLPSNLNLHFHSNEFFSARIFPERYSFLSFFFALKKIIISFSNSLSLFNERNELKLLENFKKT